MNIGKELLKIRKELELTQEEFGELFHVTRQTVSNWETGKNYPDLQTLVEMSERFNISLDAVLKGDAAMVKTIDRERLLGAYQKGRSTISMLSGAGVGLLLSCMQSPDSMIRSIMILLSVVMICSGWYKQQKREEALIHQLETFIHTVE